MLIDVVVILSITVLFGVLINRAKNHKKKFRYDEGTTLLFKQRDIKRSTLPKSVKAVQLNELDLSIDIYLKKVQVDTAKKLSKS